MSLKSLRESKNLSQEDVAKIIKVSRQTYAKIEKWEAELSLWWAVKLAELYWKNVDDFVVNEDRKEESLNLKKYIQIITNLIKYWSSSDWRIPKTKLAKLCYFADFARYYDNLCSMSWQKYIKYPHGPVWEQYFNVLEMLAEKEEIAIEQKLNSLLISNIMKVKHDLLSDEELDLIKKIWEKWKDKSSWDAEDFTHQQLPWSLTVNDYDEVPYALITQEEPDNVY